MKAEIIDNFIKELLKKSVIKEAKQLTLELIVPSREIFTDSSNNRR